jgi:tRNA pseudouridine13 synthase
MRIKQRVGDFRVRELLDEGYLVERGEHRVYRVTKRKLTSAEAARELARELGVEVAAVSMAGLKDRQAITIQYMSVPRGGPVRLQTRELRIEGVGAAREPMSSAFSRGNAFELVARDLGPDDVRRLRKNVPAVRAQGLVNYFDDQRFGNITHAQGWIARDLMRGRHERALKSLLAAPSPFDDADARRFKGLLRSRWGDWRACREIAGRYRSHHSVFEHLGRHPEDFAGAFTYVSSRLRLIHLYAYQSHLWNRAVADWVRKRVPWRERVVLESEEGPLTTHAGAPPPGLAQASFRLPGEGLEDVVDEEQRELLADVLARERLVPDQFRIEGVSGFALKGEDRALLLVPRHLRVRPAEPDPLNRGRRFVRVRFELPRGAYATLVVKRLFARALGEEPEPAAPTQSGHGGEARGHRASGAREGGAQDEVARPRRRASGSRPERGRRPGGEGRRGKGERGR